MTDTREIVDLDDATTPVCVNSFMHAVCGDGIRLLFFFVQRVPERAYLTRKWIADVMLAPSVAKTLHAELGRSLERHEKMFGPILTKAEIDAAWAKHVGSELTSDAVEMTEAVTNTEPIVVT